MTINMGFVNALMSKTRHIGEPRQASHKLNKRQFKKGCGYKEVSAKPRGFGMTRDKTFVNEPRPVLPKFDQKGYDKYLKTKR